MLNYELYTFLKEKKKKKSRLVNDLLAYTHNFIVVVCAFFSICTQFDFIFLKMNESVI